MHTTFLILEGDAAAIDQQSFQLASLVDTGVERCDYLKTNIVLDRALHQLFFLVIKQAPQQDGPVEPLRFEVLFAECIDRNLCLRVRNNNRLLLELLNSRIY